MFATWAMVGLDGAWAWWHVCRCFDGCLPAWRGAVVGWVIGCLFLSVARRKSGRLLACYALWGMQYTSYMDKGSMVVGALGIVS